MYAESILIINQIINIIKSYATNTIAFYLRTVERIYVGKGGGGSKSGGPDGGD